MNSTGAAIIMILLLCAAFLCFSPAAADQDPPDTTDVDTSAVTPPPSDSLIMTLPTEMVAGDSVGDTTASVPPLPPPIGMIDTLVYYFTRHTYPFDVQQSDLYPRNAAGFLSHEASYFSMTSYETPLRTTVAPFGLPAGQIIIRSGPIALAPYDRVVPPDGKTDFDDIATGDVAWAGVLEGPLAGFHAMQAPVALLYLEPFPIRPDTATSQFTVERGSFGYAYTRGRFARMFPHAFGMTFSTDYRKGDGFGYNGDDDSYNIKTRLTKKINDALDAGLSIGVYRRQGGYSFYRRFHRDEQYVATVTHRDLFGGQLTGTGVMQSSRMADPYRTILPRNTYVDLSYMTARGSSLLQLSGRFGREQARINELDKDRSYGLVEWSAFAQSFGLRWFAFARARAAESQDVAGDGAIGITATITPRWTVMTSVGYLGRWPDLIERYAPVNPVAGALSEGGNPDLADEHKLIGNAALAYAADTWETSLSLNAARTDHLIYYDQRYDSLDVLTVTPANDNLSYADLNLSGSFHDLWLFFGSASVSGRTVTSDRYGTRPPYCPRWQVYGQFGTKYYLQQLKVHVRLFGDITYTEPPLSYSLKELETTALVSGGINASLKDFTIYYMMHNMLNKYHLQPEGFGYTGWFYSWGFSWKLWD
jgi:hypothetical protein